MISRNYNATYVEENLLRQIEIKENQLKIAQESNMIYVAEAVESELLNLRSQLPEPQEQELQALMNLLDD
ncbi:hypothetical protein [aff. Roholtiella sp. LEGE 12411]|uniref:hypothetical protein n=1 Tax=aff. Roholtiella sp. LEGE 12411 TaxID=1828822 RepID=UPI00187E3286|nr:hypothetical protein [aff. Roholtiella sp. LEGE 12411]MBE9034919.1 hypothetical protein [aff. Roholtiella sp. LEGE 12411]